MTIRAVVFDIGGVLEITPSLGVDEARERGIQAVQFRDNGQTITEIEALLSR